MTSHTPKIQAICVRSFNSVLPPTYKLENWTSMKPFLKTFDSLIGRALISSKLGIVMWFLPWALFRQESDEKDLIVCISCFWQAVVPDVNHRRGRSEPPCSLLVLRVCMCMQHWVSLNVFWSLDYTYSCLSSFGFDYVNVLRFEEVSSTLSWVALRIG